MTRPALSLVADFPTTGSTDISEFGRDGIVISRGSTQIVTTGFVADAGTYETDLDNIDRRFDPNYTAGPYDSGADLIPGVPMVARATWNAVTYDLLTGTADDWPQDFPLDGADQLVHLRVTDGTAVFANGSLYFERPSDRSGVRVVAVADALNWTAGTGISPGNAILGPLRLGSVSAWSHLTDVAMAEWGELYFSKADELAFRSRDTILTETRSTVSQATYVQTGGLNFSKVTLSSPPIVNDCTISFNDRGDEVNAQDAASIASPWKVRSLSLSLPLKTAAQSQQYAEWVVARYKTPITTFSSITLTPSNEPGATFDLWAEALGRELGDLVTVIFDPKVNGAVSGEPIERECWIRGIQHDFKSEPWSTTFYLQDASWRTGLARFDISEWDGGDVYGM